MDDRIKKCKVKYKYVLEMPPAEDTVENLLDKLLNKHFENIYNGKESILVSPVFREGHRELIHLIFDIDNKPDPEACRYVAGQLIKRFKFGAIPENFYYELSPNGIHLVTNWYISGSNSDQLKSICKQYLNDLDIDFNASFRDVPIYRMSKGDEGLVCPVYEWNYGDHDKIKNLNISDCLDRDKFRTIMENYLFPSQSVHIDSLVRLLNQGE